MSYHCIEYYINSMDTGTTPVMKLELYNNTHEIILKIYTEYFLCIYVINIILDK